ncbi:TerC family protein [Peribacillus glennii]|uniref:TerC family protein n=1 Tax=Peribacillus glennii TaxID=2303991 RepID=A0A372LD14_9BACI|nr:TerC family protein [Peribacillus glennii]RFU63503.1 hypothetical protein D0466_12290 [Peribacillus glennii]
MDASMLLEYGWVLLVLIALEGLLAADNAVVMAIMVKHLPEESQRKALFYGLFGAFVFRFVSLFLISYLADVWQVQAIGAIYLLYIAFQNIYRQSAGKEREPKDLKGNDGPGFWMTVLKVELADIAFAIDSMLAAVALAVTLPESGWFQIGGIDGGQFMVMFLGGIIGVVMMRFAATAFVKLLHDRPSLETAAFLIVGWVGVKLAVFTLAHPAIGVLDRHFPESTIWKSIFWTILIGIAVGGFLFTGNKEKKTQET